MTAQQLSARGPKVFAPSASPSKSNSTLASPSRVPNSPSPSRSSGVTSPSSISFTATPKAATSRLTGVGVPKSLGSGRPSLATPKARVPLAVAMAPPPSPPNVGSSRSISLNDKPVTPTLSSTSNDTAVDDDVTGSLASIQENSRALQDKIRNLVAGKIPSSIRSSPLLQDEVGSEAATNSADIERIRQLEDENVRLKAELDESRQSTQVAMEATAVNTEHEQALARVQDLESQLKTSERSVKEKSTKIEALERSIQSSSDALESLRAESDARSRDLQTKVNDSEILIASLKEAVEAKSNEAGQNEGVIQAKNAEIGLLEARVKKAYSELEEMRRDLSAQVEELRQAGQETIALYEERLSSAESKRYELEDLVEELEEKLKRRASQTGSVTVQDSEVSKIDNEMLRDQVMHLQSKISGLEDLLEETRTNADKEEANIRLRMQRYRDNEVSMRSDIAEVHKEVEKLSKSEALAREKAEEAEEALRENTLALENARAEIEGLRSEFAVSGNILVVNCILTRCLGRLWKAIKPETLPKR